MTYRITGTRVDGTKHEYAKDSLAEAGYLASKMADGGVDDASILDDRGNLISVDDAFAAFVRKRRFVTFYNRIKHSWFLGRSK